MSAQLLVYTVGAELPDWQPTWLSSSGEVIDFSTGYSFELRIATDPVTVKTTGITGAAAAPNLTVAWASGELPAQPGNYRGQITARRTSDSKDRVSMEFILEVVPKL
jgi:hypothetical protein